MIDDALFETLNRRCDIVVGSRSDRLAPSVCWGMAGRVLDDRRGVEVWVREDQGRQFLADVRATGHVAAVFNEPYTNVAVQFKGTDGCVRPATRDDADFLRRHVDHMVRELARVGFGESFARVFFEQSWSLLAVVRFTAAQTFIQTPGPRAGQPMPAPKAADGDAA